MCFWDMLRAFKWIKNSYILVTVPGDTRDGCVMRKQSWMVSDGGLWVGPMGW